MEIKQRKFFKKTLSFFLLCPASAGKEGNSRSIAGVEDFFIYASGGILLLLTNPTSFANSSPYQGRNSSLTREVALPDSSG